MSLIDTMASQAMDAEELCRRFADVYLQAEIKTDDNNWYTTEYRVSESSPLSEEFTRSKIDEQKKRRRKILSSAVHFDVRYYKFLVDVLDSIWKLIHW